MPGRGMGERLAVDPNKNNILYLRHAPTGNGLWKSTDYGATWAKVTSFPNAGNYAPGPSDTATTRRRHQGIVWVTFDPRTGTAGTATQTIYVGVADKDNTVYRSTDGGATWSGSPASRPATSPHKGVLDAVERLPLHRHQRHRRAVRWRRSGDVWRYDHRHRHLDADQPRPVQHADNYFGYSGLTIDRQNPSTIMVATQVSWWPDDIYLPQHRQRRDLDADLGLDRLPEPQLPLQAWTSRPRRG